MKALKTCLAILGLIIASVSGAYAEYPERSIALIVPFGPGGGTDVQTRTIVPYVEKHLGGSIVVENRPGASGLIGMKAWVHAKPDGYTIGALPYPSGFSFIHQGTADYTMKDIIPIINQARGAMTLVVNAKSDIHSVKEFVDAAKAHPGVLTVGLTGVGHTSHMGALLFSSIADFKVTYVPFGGGAAARTAILGNHVSVAMLNVGEMAPSHKAGKVRMLAVSSPERDELAPDVPTFKELGYDFSFQSQTGFGAPAGIPDDIVAKLCDAFEKAAQEPEYLALVKKRNFGNGYMSHADYVKAVAEMDDVLAQLWKKNPWVK